MNLKRVHKRSVLRKSSLICKRILKEIEVTGVTMDKDLIDGARQLFADEIFETVRRCYCEANKDYLEKQIKIASEYMTDEQKEELRQKGIIV